MLLVLAGCTPSEPPSWPTGGAPLLIREARWERRGERVVQILPNGNVLEGGKLVLSVDRVGRIVDEDYDPVGILLPDGRLIGTDDDPLGQVGVTNAAPPWSGVAWLAVMPDGTVTHFRPDGEREAWGRWLGCQGPALRTCTLVTHMLMLREVGSAPASGVSFGVGVGVGIGF